MAGLRVERDGSILRVTLAKPERRNAFDAELIAELHEAFRDVGDARVVLLSGEGELLRRRRHRVAAIGDRPLLRRERRRRDAALRDDAGDRRVPRPVVARIQGYALGGGSGLAAAVDIAIASEDAVFGFSEVKLGIIPP